MLAVCLSVAAGGYAQLTFDTDEAKSPYVLTAKDTVTLTYASDMTSLAVMSNCDYAVEASESWLTAIVEATGSVTLHADYYYDTTDRTALLTLSSDDASFTRTVVVIQTGNDAVSSLEGDYKLTVSSATASQYNSGEGIELTIDGDYSTYYHSPWSSGTTSFPITLTYTLEDYPDVDYMVYTPRQDGNTNGNFEEIEVSYRTSSSGSWITIGTYDLGGSSDATTIDLGIESVYQIRIIVNSGTNDFAACAEMEFYQTNDELYDLLAEYFEDDIYSQLKDGVTEDDVAGISNDFVRQLVYQIVTGNYDTEYRVATFPCLLSVEALADSWNVSGKYYDQFPGVTGISFAPGTYAIAVSGLPDDRTVTLKIVAWYNGVVGDSFDGGDPQTLSYSLRNGLNVITYDPESSFTFDGDYISDYDGLGYIIYDDDEDPDAYDDIDVHFINGVVNGYLSEDKTNAEMHTLLANAVNKHMDVVASKVHAVWTADGLYSYCKSTSGGQGYRQYMNVLDSLIVWQHDVLGFTKYDRVPENRTFAYVNYTYYMFQGSLGVSFIYSQEYRVLNCNTLINNDNDAIWGLSHEWGHQHQMTPYFCWTGMTEVTNNVNAYYNVMKMGYHESDKIDTWPEARSYFIDDTYAGNTSSIRGAAYTNRSSMSWNDDFYALCQEMKDSTIYEYSEDPTRAVGASDVGVVCTLCPFIMLFVYFTENGFPDFAPDWYEALRQTDQTDDSGEIIGSTIEKQDGVDKYELIAAAQNGNKNGALSQLEEAYPNSVWVTGDYINSSHCSASNNSMPFVLNYIRKVSRLSGYNLFPYFERWGFLRVIATYIYDYGYGWQVFTQDAYDEFKEDMQALVDDGTLKEMDDDLVETISYTEDMFMDTPDIPN